MESLTPSDAYRAMLCFLQDYLDRGNTDVGSLSSTYAMPMKDGNTSDPAAWSDWLKAIDDMRSGRFAEFKAPVR